MIDYEVMKKEDLPDIDPPAIAFVRSEGIYYYCFATGWRPADNAFLLTDIQRIPQAKTQELFRGVADGTMSYDSIIRTYFESMNPLFLEVNDHDIPSGRVVFDGGKMHCIQDQIKPASWLGREVKQVGIEVLREGTPGIHLQKDDFRKHFHQWHPEPIGCVVANAAPKGSTTLTCATCPPSVATQVNDPAKSMIYTEPRDEPSDCIRPPQWYEQPGLPYRYSNEMWMTGPWQHVDIPLQSASDLGGSWPEGLSRSLTFESPIPIPMWIGTCTFMEENDWFLPFVHPGFSWVHDGYFMDTVGRSTINARMRVTREEYTGDFHRAGDTKISMFRIDRLPPGSARHSRLRGIAAGDYVAFEHDPGKPADRTLYKVTNVDLTPTHNPNTFTIEPGLRQDMTIDHGNVWGFPLSNICYWIPASTKDLTMRVFGWNDPHGNNGLPIYIKAVRGRTIELLSPLPADMPANTKMYVWSSVENETMTYAYRDPHSYAYRIAHQRQRAALLPQMEAHNAALQEEANMWGAYKQAAYKEAEKIWYSPPYSINSNLNDWFPTGLSPFNTFHDVFKDIERRRIRGIPTERASNVEYISLLNYRPI